MQNTYPTNIDEILKNVRNLAIVCNQWGDTGKGKFVDYFAPWADLIARGGGGPNAGHTIVIKDKQIILHQIPSGILHDKDGKINIMGNGMVVNLSKLIEEMNDLDALGYSYDNLKLSKDASLILPQHVWADSKGDISLEKGGVGSTGNGIRYAYEDIAAKRALLVIDLQHKDEFVRKLKDNLTLPRYKEYKELTIDEIVDKTFENFDRINPLITDTISLIYDARKDNKNILLEGAQGLLLSALFGTGKYATSSDPSINGLAQGVGIPGSSVDLTLSIVKAFYMTRVGNGPFPTEFTIKDYKPKNSEKYCAKGLEHDIFYEVKKYLGMDLNLRLIRNLQDDAKRGNAGSKHQLAKYEALVMHHIKSHREDVVKLCNSQNPFTKGVGVRLAGMEYGATTKRPRRTGWLDLVALDYARKINGDNVILTKTDVLDGVDEIKLCVGYEYNGKRIPFERTPYILYKCSPIYKTFPWGINLRECNDFRDLPKQALDVLAEIEKYVDVRIMSNGPHREQTIIIK